MTERRRAALLVGLPIVLLAGAAAWSVARPGSPGATAGATTGSISGLTPRDGSIMGMAGLLRLASR